MKAEPSKLFPFALLPAAMTYLSLLVMGSPVLAIDWNLNFIFGLFCLVPFLAHRVLRKRTEKGEKAGLIVFLALLLLNLGIIAFYPELKGHLTGRAVFLGLLAAASVFFLSFGKQGKPMIEAGAASKVFFYLAALGTVGLAVYLRLYDLEAVDSFRDEDHHIYGAKTLVESDYLIYQRAKLVTYATAFAAKYTGAVSFHDYLYAGRIPGAIMGGLATIPIFLIARRISLLTGLVAALLWATSPWAIGVSNNIREHTYYVVFITFGVLIFWHLIRHFLEERKGINLRVVIEILALAAMLIYAFFFDRFSTLKVGSPIFAAMTVSYALVNLDSVKKILLQNKWILVGAGAALLFFFGLIMRVKHISIIPNPDWGWPDTFLHAAATIPMNWWQGDDQDPYTVYCLLLAGWTGIVYYREKIPAFFFWSFMGVLIAYFLFFDRYYFPRYIFYILPLFTIFIASCLFYIWRIWGELHVSLKWIGRLASVVLLFFIFKYQNTASAVGHPGETQIYALRSTGEFHHNKSIALDYVGNRFINTPIDSIPIVSSIYDYLIYHEYDPACIIKYQYKKENRVSAIKKLASENPYGVVLLDMHRNQIWKTGLPVDSLKRPFRFEDREMQMIINKDRCQIYEWRPLPEPPDLTTIAASTEGIMNIDERQSLSFWIKPEMVTDGTIMYLSKGGNELPMIEIQAKNLNSGRMRLSFKYDRYNETSPVYLDIPINEKWQHVVWYQYGGLEGTPQGFFLNGFKANERKSPFSISGYGRFFLNNKNQQALKEIRIYEGILTDEKVVPIYRLGNNLPLADFQKIDTEYQSVEAISKEIVE